MPEFPPPTAPSERSEHLDPGVRWPVGTRIAFRFAFAYILLFYSSFAGFFAPLSLPLVALSQAAWGALVPPIATALLEVPPPPMTSDGDGLAQWITMVGCLVLAVAITLVWSVVDRERPHYAKAHVWLRVIGRYALGIAMVVYGMAKIVHLQMLPPHLAKLVQPLGESSPTSLLWILMGSSAWYSAFVGVVELVGGLLLFNRRTTTLGALISFGAMSQVVALNLAYDVSVKIWSMNLLALSLVLIVPDVRRLFDVLVRNRPSEPVEFTPLFRRPRHGRIAFRIGMVCLVFTLGMRVAGMANARGANYSRTPTPLWGIHEVQSFVSNGEVRPPLLTDVGRWRTVVIERSGLASIRMMDEKVRDFLTHVDTVAATVSFIANPDTTVTAAGATRLAYTPRLIEERFDAAVAANPDGAVVFDFTRPGEGRLALSGQWGNEALQVAMQRVDESRFLFITPSFRWVQYYPYFR